jgi:NurA-like 5'-3' nuclease
MHYSSIQSAILSGTAILQILKGLASMKLETKTLAHINTAQERISEMIAVLLGTREELIKLLKENRELRDQLRGKGWTAPLLLESFHRDLRGARPVVLGF